MTDDQAAGVTSVSVMIYYHLCLDFHKHDL